MIEANASLRALEHRNREESYCEYVKRLAAAAGLDPADTKAVRRFDQQRAGRFDQQSGMAEPAEQRC